jgi:hypothetical protein
MRPSSRRSAARGAASRGCRNERRGAQLAHDQSRRARGPRARGPAGVASGCRRSGGLARALGVLRPWPPGSRPSVWLGSPRALLPAATTGAAAGGAWFADDRIAAFAAVRRNLGRRRRTAALTLPAVAPAVPRRRSPGRSKRRPSVRGVGRGEGVGRVGQRRCACRDARPCSGGVAALGGRGCRPASFPSSLRRCRLRARLFAPCGGVRRRCAALDTRRSVAPSTGGRRRGPRRRHVAALRSQRPRADARRRSAVEGPDDLSLATWLLDARGSMRPAREAPRVRSPPAKPRAPARVPRSAVVSLERIALGRPVPCW